MDKEELMKIAVECGVTHSAEKWGCDSDGFRTSLHYFAREILERAAQECEAQANKWHGQYCNDFAIVIREMKGIQND